MSDTTLHEEEQLDEFKASFGVNAEVPPATAKKVPARRGDKNVTDDPVDSPTAVKPPGTKAGMINAMMNVMNGMKKNDLQAAYGKVMSAMGDNVHGKMKEDLDLEDEDGFSARAIPRITTEDIDVSDEVAMMFEGTEDLTEEFKEKAVTIFEAAVVAKVNEQLAKITTDFESELSEEIDNVKKELAENLDSYLDYVVEQWMEENKLAIEQGLKSEMVEDFMRGLKGLFEEHYVEIPDEKVDVVEELASKTEELESKLNEEIKRNVELKSIVEDYAKDKLIEAVSEDLTETQKAKFRTLAEGVEFKDQENFVQKLDVIKESYFGKSEEATTHYDFDEAEPIEEEVRPASGPMAVYVNAISRSIKK